MICINHRSYVAGQGFNLTNPGSAVRNMQVFHQKKKKNVKSPHSKYFVNIECEPDQI